MTKPPKRPRDPIAPAKLIGDIATGKTRDEMPERDIVESARRGGIKDGAIRAAKLAPDRRAEIAKKAAKARWAKKTSK
jgi:hypothetical protein